MSTFIVLEDPSVAWPGTPFADSKITWQQAAINIQAATGSYLTAAAKTRRVPGLKQWSGTMNGFLGTPHVGSALAVSMTSGYDANVESWSLTWSAEPKLEYTSSDSDNWMSAKLGAESWSGSYGAKLDDSEGIVMPGAAAAELTLTLSSGNTLVGDAIVTAANPDLTIGEYGMANFSFEGDDTLAVTGSNNIATAIDPLTRLAASTLTITGATLNTTSLTYSGSALLTSMTISGSTSGMFTYAIGFTGSGACAASTPDDS